LLLATTAEKAGKLSNEKYDWAAIESLYVHGSMKLIELSRDRTGKESSPPHSSLRKRASGHQWKRKRIETQVTLSLLPIAPEKREAIADLNDQVAQLIDATTVIGDHLRLSKSLKGMYGAIGTKTKLAIDNLDPTKMDTDSIIRALSVMATLVNAATDLERKSLNLAEPLQKIEIATKYVISRSSQGEIVFDEPPNLSRDEWRDKYSGQN